MGFAMRVSGWESELYTALNAKMKTPFRWGENDCALFAADIVHAITGVDYGADFRGEYDSEEGSFEILKSHGYDSLRDLMIDLFGQPVSASFLRRGDIGLLSTELGPTLGVCAGAVVFAPGKRGTVGFKLENCVMGWCL